MLPTTPLSSESERSSRTCAPHLAWPAPLFDSVPFDILSRILCPVPVALCRCIDLFVPSLQWMPWPPLLGSPAVLHLHRYHGLVRLLICSSLAPLVSLGVRFLHVDGYLAA